ncbi:hypothetical protein HLB44_36630 [Aquincola sp. S2]|uniref:Uncharacterized protein n=1 Tax=Pseudaquabacterium terrae TaxID=2732868 RepID=A0ABX2EV17_9BURK|nr:hypothetical protein [Aquabacterium terrae]
MLRFANTDNVFEMTVPVVEDASLHSVNGAVVIVDIRSHGYTATNRLWVHAPDLVAFGASLKELDRSLKGEARLTSMSPNELSLRVFAASSRGHLAVEGQTGKFVLGENGRYWHSVSFGFEFESGQVKCALVDPWVPKSGA